MIGVKPPERRCRLPGLGGAVAAFAVAGSMLCACGFQPMYGQRAPDATPVSSDLASIEVGTIPDRSGQLLRNELTYLLNPASDRGASRRYTLSVSLKEEVDTFAVERSGFATRANVQVAATYTLIDDATGNPILSGTSRAVSGFNILREDFSTYVASGDARNRAISQIAFEIRNRLGAYFSGPERTAASQT
jgi:LPS-assembly lipoprotein